MGNRITKFDRTKLVVKMTKMVTGSFKDQMGENYPHSLIMESEIKFRRKENSSYAYSFGKEDSFYV